MNQEPTAQPGAKSRQQVFHYLVEDHARRHPAKPCLVMDERTLSWAEVDREANCYGRGLAAAGISKGDRVLVMIPSGIEHVLIWLGLCKIGALMVPVNEAYKGNMLRHQARDSTACFAIIARPHLDKWHEVGAGLPELKTIAVYPALGDEIDRHAGWNYLSFGALRDADASALPPAVEYFDPMAVFYTSGTTGPSKGVLYTYAQAHATAAPAARLFSPDEVLYMFLPMFHVGLSNMFGFIAISGCTMAIRERFSMSAFWSDVRRYKASMTILLSTMPNFVMSQPAGAGDRDHPLRKIIMIPLLKNVEQFKQRFGCEVTTYYNMTEVSTPLTAQGFNLANPTSCGRLRPGISARIVDENDEPVAPGAVGELVLRADNPWEFNLGYWQNPQKTAEAWRNQWLHTGDAFTMDAQGNFYFIDRMKDAIRRRGENISSFEVEVEADAHPGVLESAAVAVPSPHGEDEVKLCVSLKPGAALQGAALLEFLKPRLPAYMLPQFIEIHAAELPKTPTGKIRKIALRESGTAQCWKRERD
jgi:carnitine-CoA ligase